MNDDYVTEPRWAAVDVETSGLRWWSDALIGIGIYCDDDRKYFYTGVEVLAAKEKLRELEEEGFLFTAHNSKFDYGFLRANGIELNFSFDTQTCIPLLKDRPNSKALEPAAVHYLKAYPWKDSVQRKSLVHEAMEDIREYCLTDCEYTVQLTHKLIQKLHEEGQYDFFTKRLHILDGILCRASFLGFSISVSEVNKQLARYQEESEKAVSSIRERHREYIEPYETLLLFEKLAKYKTDKSRDKVKQNPPQINLKSSKQLLTLLTQYAGIEMRDVHGKPSTSDDAMYLASDHEIVQDIVKYRALQKPMEFFSQWLEMSDHNNVIHTTFNVDIARTGRLSSSSPNMQQLPVRKDPKIRNCFVAREGRVLVIRDLSQIEPRFIAHYSQDPKLLKVYRDGISLYGQVACELGLWEGDPNELKAEDKTIYNVAKTLVLAILYNLGPRKMAFELKKVGGGSYSTSQCRAFIDKFFSSFAGIATLRENVTQVASDRGYLKNFFGRHVFVPKEKAYRIAMNSLIQSSASDFMAMLQIYQQKKVAKLGADLLLLVHDEEVYEVDEANAVELDNVLTDAASEFAERLSLKVPVTTEGGLYKCWGGEPWKESR